MSLRLIIEDDEGSTTVVPLGKEIVTIGRQQGNTIQLTEKNVSRRHAKLTPEGETWILEDLGSYNGIKINGRPATGRTTLHEGDVVQIGDYHLALTEDVDRRTLNYDRARAANDAEPMLASSSTNLPRLSPEEIAALSSGQHPQHNPAVAPPMFVDSGQMPVSRPSANTGEPPRRAGAMLALGLVGIGAVALLGFWWISRPEPGPGGTQVAAADTKGPANAAAGTKPTPATPPAAEAKAQSPTPAVPPTPEPTPAEPKPDTKVDEPSSDAGEEPEPTIDPPQTSPKPAVAKSPEKPTPAPTPKKPPVSSPPSKPTPPPVPEVNAEELLDQAGKAALKDPAQGYELASKAYKAKPTQRAAFIMAKTACKLGDKGKATKAVSKLSKGSEYYSQALEICGSLGIDVG
ncbi:MAG: FHA domain-containing protein [Nannocystaceae bacterium]